MDCKSVEVILDWALYHHRKAIVTDLLPFYSKLHDDEENFVLEGRIALFIIRDLAENLNYNSPVDITLLLENLVELETHYLEFIRGMNQTEWSYWKREIVVQGAVGILQRQINPIDSNNPNLFARINASNSTAEEIYIARSADANQFILDIVRHFEDCKFCYFDATANQQNSIEIESTDEDLRKNHLRSFTDATQTKDGKMLFNRSKVSYLMKTNDWKLKKPFFLKFLNKFERSVFPIKPVISVEYGDADSSDETMIEIEPSGASLLNEVAEIHMNRFNKDNQNAKKFPILSEKRSRRRSLMKRSIAQITSETNNQNVVEVEDSDYSLVSAANDQESDEVINCSSSRKRRKKSGNKTATYQTPIDENPNPYQTSHEDYDLEQIKFSEERKNSSSKKRKTDSLTSNLDSSNPLPQFKNKWTIEEQMALEGGIRRYGAGKWREILDDPEFSPALILRTNINLKDRYRVMEKKGWLPDGPSYVDTMRSKANFSNSF